jgi:hypothetical protein
MITPVAGRNPSAVEIREKLARVVIRNDPDEDSAPVISRKAKYNKSLYTKDEDLMDSINIYKNTRASATSASTPSVPKVKKKTASNMRVIPGLIDQIRAKCQHVSDIKGLKPGDRIYYEIRGILHSGGYFVAHDQKRMILRLPSSTFEYSILVTKAMLFWYDPTPVEGFAEMRLMMDKQQEIIEKLTRWILERDGDAFRAHMVSNK